LKCDLEGCPGDYEPRNIAHTVRHGGRVVVIDHVPAEVCDICGDVLLRPETIRHLELLLKSTQPASSAPLYEYA
jgi:YgiT-type zinc finger domain-containing protein